MFRGRRHPNRRNNNPESQEIEEHTSCWGKLTELERTLISVIFVELFFLLVTSAIALAFFFPWSPWSNSEKCGELCQNEVSRGGGSWRENVLDETRNEEPDENWAEIPDELYHFVTMLPFGFDEDEDYDNNITKQITTTSGRTMTKTGGTLTPLEKTTTTTGTTTTTVTTLMTTTEKCPDEGPPVSILFERVNQDLVYKCTAALMSASLALVYNDGCIPQKDHDYDFKKTEGWYIIHQRQFINYVFKYELRIETNIPKTHIIRSVFQIFTLKKLSALHLADPYNADDCWYGQYLSSYVTAEKANAFTWDTRSPMENHVMWAEKIKTVIVDLKGKAVQSSLSTSPLFIAENNRYYLAGFASKTEIMLNIYLGEYKNWLMKQ